MKVISDTAEYALRAVVWLVQTPDESQTTRQIAEGTRTPLDYQSKVLQSLAKSGITKSQRGTRGGIRLNVSPDGLSVLDVINAVDPIQRIHSCPLGLKEHGSCLCPMHRGLNDAVKTVEAAFKETLVVDLLKTRSKSMPLGIDLPRRIPSKPKFTST